MSGYPQRYVVLDTETNSTPVKAPMPTQRLTFRLGCALVVDPHVYGDSEEAYFEFTDRDEFIPLLYSLPLTKEPIYVFAHNMGFDSRIVGLWDHIGSGALSLLPPPQAPGAARYKSPLFIVESPPFIVRVFRADGQSLLWLDTYQWLQASLENVGEWIGVKKGMTPDPDQSDEVWMKYCRQDVRTLHAALKRLWSFLRSHGIPDWNYTPAGLSRQVYRMRYEKKRITIPEDTDILKLDRMAYYCGRSDCFRVGEVEGPIYKVDVNSLYPHMMGQKLFPCEVIDHGDSPDGVCQLVSDHADACTAEVLCDTRGTPLPVRSLDGTYHCRGRVRTVLCGPELSREVCAGRVIHIYRWVHYKVRDLFSGWVRYWSGSRRHANNTRDRLGSAVVKAIMNSLHGKFGQQVGEWQVVGKDCPKGAFGSGRLYSPECAKWIDWRVMDGWRSERPKGDEDPRSFVPIAAWTASYARVYMDWMREIAGETECLYQATDSLLVTARGYHALKGSGLIDTGEIGHFKTEGTYNKVVIWNVNQLDLGASKVRSGVRKGSLEIEPGIWSCERWERCADGVYSTGQDSVTIANILTQPSLRYSRGVVTSDGTTRPYWIDNSTLSPERQALMSLPIRDEPGEQLPGGRE